MGKIKTVTVVPRLCIVITAVLFMLPAATGQKTDKSQSKIVITGTVTGLDGKPAANAQIYVDSIDTGITTNNLGKYRVKVNPAAKTIYAWSFMKGGGEAPVDGKSIVDIRLDPRKDTKPVFSAKTSDENESPTSSKKPKKLNTYTNIFEMIRQEVPGVLVSGNSIVVQQQNSFFGSSAPLYVVNGVRVSSISNINPRDVESIVLLKGSQAAIYGVEGANGVISITLKAGAVK
jgi:TonB-dependent SusC/RagA subfamily outer membrane receptor